MAPKRYKRSVVSGFVYRIFRACSDWTRFHVSLERGKKVLERNQYPPGFYVPIIEQALRDILGVSDKTTATPAEEKEDSVPECPEEAAVCPVSGQGI